ncbi:MAG TPA: BamA/TamA family outer membrane protein [Flavisolibacter sp.]|nr:BamA/TamA family outer membrane protein [Flavisolibacter sp.]
MKAFLLVCSQAVSALCFAQYPFSASPPPEGDTVVHALMPNAGSDHYYRIYVGASYNITKYRTNKKPYAAKHSIGLNYSITENSFHPYYEGDFPQALGQWGLALKAGYDGIRRTNFYGLGNETVIQNRDTRFNWVRTHHQYVSFGVERPFATHHRFNFNLLYDGIQVLNEDNRFISKDQLTIEPAEFDWQYFIGTQVQYTFNNLDNEALPTRGFEFVASGIRRENLQRGGHSFNRYTADLQAFFPLSSKFTYSFHSGVATLTGHPDFYLYNSIGGTRTVRGYNWYRFYGKTSFYNQNDLLWITQVNRGSIYGRFGFLAFYDIGRVWMPGEESDKMHYGYGVGLVLVPLDRFVFKLMFGISNEDWRINTGLEKL